MIVALIPARGGSKRLPRKNVLPFAGRPLIAHSIGLSRRVRAIGATVVSTDDDEIAEVSREHGATVLWRPAELADDHATTASVVKHALESWGKAGLSVEAVVTLQPNCPLRPPGLIERAIQLYRELSPDSVISVTESRHKLGEVKKGRFIPAYRPGTRSQDLAPRYFENGLVYVTRPALVLETNDMFGADIVPVVADSMYALGDIDTRLDFEIAEFLFERHLPELAGDHLPAASLAPAPL